MVLCRIYKVDDIQGKKRFNVTLRKSLVVFGTNAIERDSMAEGVQVECQIATFLDEKTRQLLVQILVVVANIQMRTLKAEVEKGSM